MQDALPTGAGGDSFWSGQLSRLQPQSNAHKDALMPPLVYETVARLRFYSCLPLPALPGETEAGISPNAAPAHTAPLAGALIGAAGGIALVLAVALGASNFVAAAIALLVLVAVTCGRPERALALSAERFSGAQATEALTVGTRIMGYGVLAIVLAVLLRVGAIDGLTFHGAWKAALALIAGAAVARGATAAFAMMRPAPAESGVSTETDKSELQWIAIFALGIAVVAVLPAYGLGAALAGIAAAAGAVALYTAFVPGEAQGSELQPASAAELVAEIAFLIAVLAFASHPSIA